MITFYSLAQKILELGHSMNRSHGRILMLHQVDDKQNWENINFAITKKSFSKLIESLVDGGHTFISLDNINPEEKLTPKTVALTFDDGYSDLKGFVSGYLNAKRIPYTTFVTTNFLNKPGYLNFEQLKSISSDSLCTVGAHSVNHPLLRKLNGPDSRNEIAESKRILEDLLSKKIDYFAYPYGSLYSVSFRDINYVKATGYRLAFCSVHGCINKETLNYPWFIPRIAVNEFNYRQLG